MNYFDILNQVLFCLVKSLHDFDMRWGQVLKKIKNFPHGRVDNNNKQTVAEFSFPKQQNGLSFYFFIC